jgi:hypothetical protein
MNLAESVRNCVLSSLPYDKTDPGSAGALKAMRPRELLVLWLNWRGRLIPPVPRQVMASPVFDHNPIVRQRSAIISQVIDDIERGRALLKYLSRNATMGFTLTKSFKKELKKVRHLDLLLNDWGIHHLHISTNVEADGFVERDDPVILAIFTSERAYLIDVMRVVLDTWPDDGLVRELTSFLGTGQTFTNEERLKQRSAGLSAFVQIDGRIYWPGTAISTAGFSINAVVRSGRIMRALKSFEEQVESDPTGIVELMRQHGGNPPDQPDFEFRFFQDGFGVVETTSGFAIGLRA